MNYGKKWLSLDEQLTLLKKRNLVIKDQSHVLHFLSRVNYYKFSAYLKFFDYPIADNYRNNTFEDVKKLYRFDEKLRKNLFNIIERIEISLKTQFAYVLGEENCFAHIDPLTYRAKFRHETSVPFSFIKFEKHVKKEEYYSKEPFITAYKNKYTSESYAPVWMAVEILSYGQISKAILALNGYLKPKICHYYNIELDEMDSWLKTINVLRNRCAHNNRIWNFNFHEIIVSNTRKNLVPNISFNKLIGVLFILKYLLNIIEPNISLKEIKEDIIGFVLNPYNQRYKKELGFSIISDLNFLD